MTNSLIRPRKIILASQSPRRKQLLEGIGLNFEVNTSIEVDERYPAELKNEQIALYLAELKATAYESLLHDDALLITADTIVLLRDEVLGKPEGYNAAVDMLKRLSGNMHRVITGVCMWTVMRKVSFYDVSDVWFRRLTEEEIRYYISRFTPYDKAGAYGVQEWIGYVGIEKVEGSYFNVMGLPVHRVYHELKKF